MSFLTITYALLFYAATVLLVAGLARKITQYAKTPAPLKIPTTPAPVTRTGVVMRMFRELVFFESLFKSNKWIWIFGWMFHYGMFLVLARHLRYFTNPVWTWVDLIQPFGKYAAFAMAAGLLGLWVRASGSRPRPLYHRPVRPPDAGPAVRHRRHRPDDGLRDPHRYCFGKGIFPRPDVLSTGSPSRRTRCCWCISVWLPP